MSQQRLLLFFQIDKEFKTIDYCWHQGQTAFKDAQKSAKKIFKLLKLMNGTLFSTRDILKIMGNRLSHLNGISDWKLKILLGDDL